MNARILIALPLLAAFAAGPALADRDKHRNGRGHHDNRPVAVQHDRGNNPHANGRHDNGRHLGWYKQGWRRGDRIDWTYVEPVYYVEDYRTYNLTAPPAGYRWVRPMDDRYILVEVATGLIIEALGY